jgi:hypothetical protein
MENCHNATETLQPADPMILFVARSSWCEEFDSTTRRLNGSLDYIEHRYATIYRRTGSRAGIPPSDSWSQLDKALSKVSSVDMELGRTLREACESSRSIHIILNGFDGLSTNTAWLVGFVSAFDDVSLLSSPQPRFIS